MSESERGCLEGARGVEVSSKLCCRRDSRFESSEGIGEPRRRCDHGRWRHATDRPTLSSSSSYCSSSSSSSSSFTLFLSFFYFFLFYVSFMSSFFSSIYSLSSSSVFIPFFLSCYCFPPDHPSRPPPHLFSPYPYAIILLFSQSLTDIYICC